MPVTTTLALTNPRVGPCPWLDSASSPRQICRHRCCSWSEPARSGSAAPLVSADEVAVASWKQVSQTVDPVPSACSPLQLCHPLGVECRFPDRGASSSPALQLAVARSCGPRAPRGLRPSYPRSVGAGADAWSAERAGGALGGKRHLRAIQRSIVSSSTPPDVFALSECSPCSKTRIMRELPSSTSAVRPRASC